MEATNQYITVNVSIPKDFCAIATFVYAKCNREERQLLWRDLLAVSAFTINLGLLEEISMLSFNALKIWVGLV